MVHLIYSGLIRSSNSPITMPHFLSTPTVIFQVKVLVSIHGSRLLASSSHPCNPSHLYPTLTQDLPKPLPGSGNKLVKKAFKGFPCLQQDEVWSVLLFQLPLQPNTFPLAQPDWSLEVTHTSWYSHFHPRTTMLIIPPHWDSSCLLSFCIVKRGGRRKHITTTARKRSTKQRREPFPC